MVPLSLCAVAIDVRGFCAFALHGKANASGRGPRGQGAAPAPWGRQGRAGIGGDGTGNALCCTDAPGFCLVHVSLMHGIRGLGRCRPSRVADSLRAPKGKGTRRCLARPVCLVLPAGIRWADPVRRVVFTWPSPSGPFRQGLGPRVTRRWQPHVWSSPQPSARGKRRCRAGQRSSRRRTRTAPPTHPPRSSPTRPPRPRSNGTPPLRTRR